MNPFKHRGIGMCVAVGILAAGAIALAAQPKDGKPGGQPTKMPQTPEEINKHMEEMGQLAEPGTIHKLMADRAGTYAIKTQFTIPGQPGAAESSGEATVKPVLGGRFVVHDEAGELMGEKFNSIKTWGYNRETGEFEAVWMYTGSTAMMVLKGKSDDNGRTVKFASEVVSGGNKERFEVTMRQLTPDSFSVELSGSMEDGTRGPTMLSTYTRKK